MKILFVSGCAPVKFNVGEPNAYPYYIIKEIAKDHETMVLYYNNNPKLFQPAIKEELEEAGVSQSYQIQSNRFLKLLQIALYLPKALTVKLAALLGFKPLRFFVPFPLTVYKSYPNSNFEALAREFSPEVAIVFPIQLYFPIKKLRQLGIRTSVLCTDSPSLHFSRQLDIVDRIKAKRNKSLQSLSQSQKLESAYRNANCKYFFVGEDDKKNFAKLIGGSEQCFFLPHHLYSSTLANNANWENPKKIKILFAGGITIYTGDEPERIAKEIAGSNISPAHVTFLFLGNGYDSTVKILSDKGYEVQSFLWVEDYDEFIQSIHVQIFPIILGTGTKAKVLSAMASGVVCIGTKFAFENILTSEEYYLRYNTPNEIPGLIMKVISSKTNYHEISIKNRDLILRMHDSEKISKRLLEEIQNV